MTIPDFQTVMRPLLNQFADGNVHYVRELIDPLADEFGLSPEERKTLLPSGGQGLFRNRVGWAVSHVMKAGLLERPGHGRYRITDRGRAALEAKSHRIDVSYLKQFPEYREVRTAQAKAGGESVAKTSELSPDQAATPRETLEQSYYELRATLARDVLDAAKSVSPGKFEEIVVELLVAMGYGGSGDHAARAVGRSGDEGIDGVINEDKLGLDSIYIQAKRWENVVGRPVVQAFSGSLDGFRARKGVMITTSSFTPGAHDFVAKIEKSIVLIDGNQLAELMIDYGIGVSEVQSYSIYRIDTDVFLEE